MGRRDEFYIGVHHSPELVEAANVTYRQIASGGRTIPSRIHELPHELLSRTGAKEAVGVPIDVTRDPRIPTTVYHVTTNKAAVEQSGRLMASPGAGGLGGHHSRVVSITTDRRQAFQIMKDLKFAGHLAKRFGPTEPPYQGTQTDRSEWGHSLVGHLQDTAQKEGWEFSGAHADVQLKGYGLSDWLTHFHHERARKHPDRERVNVNPVVLGEGWRNIDPAKVGIVRVHRHDIARTGALVTDFDLEKATHPGTRYGLSEIRVHGDVPVRRARR